MLGWSRAHFDGKWTSVDFDGIFYRLAYLSLLPLSGFGALTRGLVGCDVLMACTVYCVNMTCRGDGSWHGRNYHRETHASHDLHFLTPSLRCIADQTRRPVYRGSLPNSWASGYVI